MIPWWCSTKTPLVCCIFVPPFYIYVKNSHCERSALHSALLKACNGITSDVREFYVCTKHTHHSSSLSFLPLKDLQHCWKLPRKYIFYSISNVCQSLILMHRDESSAPDRLKGVFNSTESSCEVMNISRRNGSALLVWRQTHQWWFKNLRCLKSQVTAQHWIYLLHIM